MEVVKSLHLLETMEMKRINLLFRIGRCQISIEEYKASKNTYQTVLELRKRVLGDEHLDTLASMHGFALAFHGQRKYVEAEIIYRETLALRKKVLGDEHPYTLASMHGLALFFIVTFLANILVFLVVGSFVVRRRIMSFL